MLYCPKCRQTKPVDAFTKSANRKSKYHGHCKACKAAFAKEWARNHRETVNAKARDYGQRMRRKMLEVYGGKCACCGETEEKFLALDHVNGGGTAHKKGGGVNCKPIAIIIKREGYPQDGRYQVLCHNCNMAKGFYGVCPHTQKMSMYETTANYGDRSEGSLDPSLRSGSDWFIQ